MKMKMVNNHIIVLCSVWSVFLWKTLEATRIPDKATFALMEAFSDQMGNHLSQKNLSLPIDTTFKLPAPIPAWPPGDGFASGTINLGELQVMQISTFLKVWASYEGGPDNLGASIFEPTGQPEGFSMLGSYIQPNNKPLFGWVLVAKDSSSTSNPSLKEPLDYTLIFSTESLQINQSSSTYFWQPNPPDGYIAVGLVVTTTQDKPSLDKIQCVRSDLTDQIEKHTWIWGIDPNGFNVYETRPSNRSTQAQGLPVGTFLVQNVGNTSDIAISCLKNTNVNLTYMPNLQQVQAIVQAYSPIMYIHPDEEYLPASINWFSSNGGLLYKKGDEANPTPLQPNGTNLPQDPNTDGAYWLDLPADNDNKERVKKGDLQSAQAYMHVKPMYGGTFTDIACWVYYPFNGAGRVKLEFITISLGFIGEHIGDWEHVTLRVSNFDGELKSVYFSEHSGGKWVDSSGLEFKNGNKPVVYASLHGHAFYPTQGINLKGSNIVGLRDDTADSNMTVDMGVGYEVVCAEYLGTEIVEPPWVNYYREWGPKINYDIVHELDKIEKWLPAKLKKFLDCLMSILPKELFGEEGPTGPKVKNSWNGDEVDH